MTNLLDDLKGLDAQTQIIVVVLVAISLLLLLAIIYTITRKRAPDGPMKHEREIKAVSYTHLTLPTILLV